MTTTVPARLRQLRLFMLCAICGVFVIYGAFHNAMHLYTKLFSSNAPASNAKIAHSEKDEKNAEYTKRSPQDRPKSSQASQPQQTATPSTAAASPKSSLSASPVRSSTSQGASSKVAQPVVPTPPNCTKDTSYQPVGAISISTASPGLKQQIDAARYYDVYGYTADQVRTQLNQCFPASATSMGDTDGATSYWLNYAYTIYTKAGSTCNIKDVAVGVHVGFLYPRWTNTQYAAAGLSASWQNFITNLTTHANGHKDIAISYASSLFNTLQSYGDTDCATIDQSVKNYSQNLISIMYLNQASYDANNKHGTTQGVKFP